MNSDLCASLAVEFQKELPTILKKICEGEISVKTYVDTLGLDKDHH